MANKIHTKIGLEDHHLDLLSKFELADRGLGLSKALRKAANVVAKRAKELCPKPGYPGDDPSKKPLRDTIGVVVREYMTAIVIYVGPQYPAGAHGHLIEFGHHLVLFGVETSIFVAAKPFMRPAADETKSEQIQAITNSLQSDLAKFGRQS